MSGRRFENRLLPARTDAKPSRMCVEGRSIMFTIFFDGHKAERTNPRTFWRVVLLATSLFTATQRSLMRKVG